MNTSVSSITNFDEPVKENTKPKTVLSDREMELSAIKEVPELVAEESVQRPVKMSSIGAGLQAGSEVIQQSTYESVA